MSSIGVKMPTLDYARLDALLACPNCRRELALGSAAEVTCGGCGDVYRRGEHGTWCLIPSLHRARWSAAWDAWETVQANGLTAYQLEPARNLGVGPRADCEAFSRFCRFDGTVLDIGFRPAIVADLFRRSCAGHVLRGRRSARRRDGARVHPAQGARRVPAISRCGVRSRGLRHLARSFRRPSHRARRSGAPSSSRQA